MSFEQRSRAQPQQLRETLRVHLIRAQVEEATTDDKRASLMQRLSLVSNAFEAFAQHLQSVEVSYLAADRVYDTSRALLAYHDPPSSADEDFVSHYRQVVFSSNDIDDSFSFRFFGL